MTLPVTLSTVKRSGNFERDSSNWQRAIPHPGIPRQKQIGISVLMGSTHAKISPEGALELVLFLTARGVF